MSTQHYTIFETAQGHAALAWSERGITRARLPEESAQACERGMLRRVPEATPAAPPPRVARTAEDMKRYFAGERVGFAEAALDLGEQSKLFARIYDAARRLGWGETTTYGALAKSLGGDWEMAREVGQAMAKNRVPLIIPCHRVLAAGGKPGGFSAPGGTATKLRMLKMEGVDLGPPKPAQAALF
jgi:methylated-DNA-[protein]-cysteine S-methyltransferase